MWNWPQIPIPWYEFRILILTQLILLHWIISTFFGFTEHSHNSYKYFVDHRQLSSICCFTIRSRCCVWFATGVGRSQAIGTKCRCFSTKQMVFGWNRPINIEKWWAKEMWIKGEILCYYCYIFVDNYIQIFFNVPKKKIFFFK